MSSATTVMMPEEANFTTTAEQTSATSTTKVTANTASPPPKPVEPEWWSNNNAMTMCAVILIFGLLVLALSGWLIRSGQQASSVLRVFGTILVIIMATFLVVAGYDDSQIGAPLGLLGTIVGYLLGRDSSRSPERREEAES